MTRTYRSVFASMSFAAALMLLDLGGRVQETLAQAPPRRPAGSYYYYPAPTAPGSSPSASFYEPAPSMAVPNTGYYYYPAQPNTSPPAAYYYYPGQGSLRPPQSVYYYYPAPSPTNAYVAPRPASPTPARAYTLPAPVMQRGLFGFPRPVNSAPRPSIDDPEFYEYRS